MICRLVTYTHAYIRQWKFPKVKQLYH